MNLESQIVFKKIIRSLSSMCCPQFKKFGRELRKKNVDGSTFMTPEFLPQCSDFPAKNKFKKTQLSIEKMNP